MRTHLINPCYKKADAVGALAVVLSVGLGAVADGGYKSLDGDSAAVG
jgi:hypothetical protein